MIFGGGEYGGRWHVAGTRLQKRNVFDDFNAAFDHDDRVAPWHSFRFAAATQIAQACANPILIRVETGAGHGAGKPTWMQIEGVAYQWAFLATTLNMGG